MTTRIHFAPLLLVLSIVGCASNPVPTSQAKPVPAERQFLYRKPGPETVQIVVKRDTAFSSGGCPLHIYIDNRKAATLWPGEKVTLNIPMDSALLGAEMGSLCMGGLMEQALTLETSNIRAYRIGSDSGLSFAIYPTAR